MDARRAADRIVTAVRRRRSRIVLTPMAKAAGLGHGVAPALTTGLSALAAGALPSPSDQSEAQGPHKGRDIEPGPGRARHPVARRLRAWGIALNDRAARRLNQRLPHHAQGGR